MLKIVTDASLSNEARSTAMEQYLLQAGEAAGVISSFQIKAPLNPNRFGKHLAPWFDDSCRHAKAAHRATCHTEGKNSDRARAAYRTYLGACKKAKWAYSQQLPELLKYNPAEFWKLLKTKNSSAPPVNLQKFADFNDQLFKDSTASVQGFQALRSPATSAITADELETVLQRYFKANKSSGLSVMPL